MVLSFRLFGSFQKDTLTYRFLAVRIYRKNDTQTKPGMFESISINYVLHCLAGSMDKKASTIFHLISPLLAEGSVLFGGTVLWQGVQHNFLGKLIMSLYNTIGIFDNSKDSVSELKETLEKFFPSCSLEIVETWPFLWPENRMRKE